MDRSRLTRAARHSLLRCIGPALVGIVALIWAVSMTAAVGWLVVTPAAWIADIRRTTPDDQMWQGLLLGGIAWFLLVLLGWVIPAAAGIVAVVKVSRWVRRWRALHNVDPGAVPDLVLVRPDEECAAASVAGHPRRVAVTGTLERLAPTSGLASALDGETRVAVLGDSTVLPAHAATRLDGYLLNRASRSSAVVVVDRENDQCWLMGHIVPQSALVTDPTATRRHSSDPARARPTAGDGAPALIWAHDAGGWQDSGGGWGDGGTDSGSGGDGGDGDGGAGGGAGE